MASGAVDGRQEDEGGSGALGGPDLPEVVRRSGPEALAGAGAVASVGGPGPGFVRGAAEQQQMAGARAIPRTSL